MELPIEFKKAGVSKLYSQGAEDMLNAVVAMLEKDLVLWENCRSVGVRNENKFAQDVAVLITGVVNEKLRLLKTIEPIVVKPKNVVSNYEELFYEGDVNLGKFVCIDGDSDGAVYEAELTQELTKEQHKDFYRLIRLNSAQIPNCGHEHDCCGCICSQNMSVERSGVNKLKVKYSIGYNY